MIMRARQRGLGGWRDMPSLLYPLPHGGKDRSTLSPVYRGEGQGEGQPGACRFREPHRGDHEDSEQPFDTYFDAFLGGGRCRLVLRHVQQRGKNGKQRLTACRLAQVGVGAE